ELAVTVVLLGLFLGFLGGVLGLSLLVFDHVDAHFTEHGEDVLDLVRGDFLGGEDGVDLVVGDVTAFLRRLDHLADGGVRKVEQRQRRIGRIRSILFGGRLFLLLLNRYLQFARHTYLSSRDVTPAVVETGNWWWNRRLSPWLNHTLEASPERLKPRSTRLPPPHISNHTHLEKAGAPH